MTPAADHPDDQGRRRARTRWIAGGVFAALVVGTVAITVAGASRHQIPVFATDPGATPAAAVTSTTTPPHRADPARTLLGIALGPTDPRVLQATYGSPAATVGIAPGDLITAVGGTPVATSAALANVLERAAPGAKLRITWKDADGRDHTATVGLAAAP